MSPNGHPRTLLRELKRRSRQPKRWDSLPCLQLPPENRPLFVCPRCKFSNSVSELCPWCFCTCDAIALVAAVRRRVSSPTLLNEQQKMQLARVERAAGGAFLVKTSFPGPGATRRLPDSDGASVPQADAGIGHGDDLRRRHRNAVLYSATDVVATATSDTTLQPFLDQIAAAHLEHQRRSILSSSATATTTTTRTTRASRQHTPQTPRTLTPTTSKHRTRMSNRDVDLANTSEPAPDASTPSPSSSPLPPDSQTPCLRRKRRLPVLRQRSSCSLRRRATTSSIGSFYRDSTIPSPGSPRPKTTTSLTSTSRSDLPRSKPPTIRFSTPPPGSGPDAIPLGHPQRPIYTAIRKNMTRPESPSPPPSTIAPAFDASFQTLVYDRQTRSLDIESAPRYSSLSRASRIAVGPTAYARPALFTAASGFSVSGETELRMDLARSRSMDGVPSDFAFRQVKPDGVVKAKVKSLGKTLKSFLKVKN